MRESYDSDITREQFQHIESLLEGARKKTKPRKADLYDVFCALLYVLKTGCQWRLLPKEFPQWQNVYAYYAIWRERPRDNQPSLLEQALKKSGRSGPHKIPARGTDHVSDR